MRSRTPLNLCCLWPTVTIINAKTQNKPHLIFRDELIHIYAAQLLNLPHHLFSKITIKFSKENRANISCFTQWVACNQCSKKGFSLPINTSNCFFLNLSPVWHFISLSKDQPFCSLDGKCCAQHFLMWKWAQLSFNRSVSSLKTIEMSLPLAFWYHFSTFFFFRNKCHCKN